jgi:mannose-6-phosphate isomerase-like protein (cupin superfamily)
MPKTATTVEFDLERLAESGGTGPVFGQESTDLDLTFLRWNAGHRIVAHANDEVDVVMIVVDGEGSVVVDEQKFEMEKGKALLIPKGTRREIVCGDSGMCYLNVHKRRQRLMPTLGGKPPAR